MAKENHEYELMKKVVYSHFIDEKKQNVIANEFDLSVSKVSRLIKQAKDNGYVKVDIQFPNNFEHLKEKFNEYFDLDYCYISEFEENNEMLYKDISTKLSSYIHRHSTYSSFIGVSWGETLKKISKYFEKNYESSASIVQLNGGITHTTLSTNSTLILNNFKKAFGKEIYLLSAPSIVSSVEIAEAITGDASIKETMELYDSLDMAVFSVGNVNNDIISVNAGYLDSEEIHHMRNEEVVGDIASRFYFADGSYVEDDLYQRAIGIDLKTLEKIPQKIAVVLSIDKLESTVAALKGNYINTLFVNYDLAKALIKFMEEKNEETNRN